MPCAPIHDVPAALADPHTQHRGMVVEIDDEDRGVGRRRLSRTPATYRVEPPQRDSVVDSFVDVYLDFVTMRISTIRRASAATVAACISSAAMADASLTLNQTSAECVIDQRVGDVMQRTVAPCAPGPAFMVVGNSTRGGPYFSFIQLSYAFAYRDDGLVLPSAVTLTSGDYGGATTSAFARPPSVSFESATLNVDVSSTFGPNPAGPGYVIRALATDAPSDGISFLDGYLMFGLNDHPDAFSGNITVTVGVTSFGLQDLAQVSGVSVTPSVAAIPEPSTWALLLSGMALLAHFCRGARSDRTHFRWRSVGV